MNSTGRSSKSPQKPAIVQDQPSTPSMFVNTSSEKVIIPTTRQDTTRYLHIASELRTIGILAGIMLLGLFALAQIVG